MYSHECFQRNKPEYLDYLRRKTNNSPYIAPSKRCLFLDEHSLLATGEQDSPCRGKKLRTESTTSEEIESSCSSEDRESEDSYPARQSPIQDGRKVISCVSASSLYSHKWESAINVICASNSVADVDPTTNFKSCTPTGLQNETIEHILRTKFELSRQKELLYFCLCRNPFESSRSLFLDVNELLADNLSIVEDLNCYLKALHPAPISRHYAAAPVDNFRSNELLLMRSFMTFALVQLQDFVEFLETEPCSARETIGLRRARNQLSTWSNFTKLFI